jgi:hypothetical protein
MKKSLLFLLLVSVLSVHAQDNRIWQVKLQKEYNKSYPVGKEGIILLNQHGKMSIETWDKQEVRVEAKISVSAQNNDYATKLLEGINIKDEIKDGNIMYQTELAITNSYSDDNSSGHEMHIDWVAHIPANARLQAENNFGAMTIGDFKGESVLVSKYGSLTAGKLSNCRDLRVEFGKATIASLSDSRVLFRYARALDIGKLSGKIEGEMLFCNSVDLPVDNDLKQLTLKNNYTNLYLMVPKDISADYDITTTNARVTAKNDMVIREEKEPETNAAVRRVSYTPNRHYTGSLGKGGGLKIEIRSNFGNIRVL